VERLFAARRGLMRRRMMTLPHVRIGGFALVTAPAEYAVTGVKTFNVSHDGWFTKKIIQRTSSGLQGLGVIRSSTGYPTSSLDRKIRATPGVSNSAMRPQTA
jgi:hypothetical protein